MEIEIEKSENLIKEQHDCSQIKRISSENLTFNQFFNEFMLKNTPVIVLNVDLLKPASRNWFTKDNEFIIDNFLVDLKDMDVPVYNCSKQYFNSHEKTTMKLTNFANYWKSNSRNELLYLKDFHLSQQGIDFYNVPHCFSSDWLNEYLLDTNKDDYRFVYIGVKGTWTPLHADVFNSYSWSGNVSGRKRWFMLYPKEEQKLKDSLGNLPFSIDEQTLQDKNVRYFDIIQEPNEILFVPSQWYHQVFNLTDVFSINHNWFNSCNIHVIKDNLVKNLKDVRAEIQDCSDMDGFDDHCQLMLKSLFGMNLADFVDVLVHIGSKRLRKESFKLFDEFQPGINLVSYELKVICEILKDMLTVADVPPDLKLKIKNYLKDDAKS